MRRESQRQALTLPTEVRTLSGMCNETGSVLTALIEAFVFTRETSEDWAAADTDAVDDVEPWSGDGTEGG